MTENIHHATQKCIDIYPPGLYKLVQNITKINIQLNKIFEPVRASLKTMLMSKEFQELLKMCQYVAVKVGTSEYFWIISDKTLINQLKRVSKENYTNIIIDYYKNNNFSKIKHIVDYWTKNCQIENRLHIFNSCCHIMCSSLNIEDVATSIIPTLTAQITGISEDIYNAIPEKEKIKIEEKLRATDKSKKPSNGTITTQYLFELGEGRLAIDCYQLIYKAVLINQGDFKKLTDSNFDKYNKFRNKILHGDTKFLNYGSLENLIRSWLELDFLIKVYCRIREIQTAQTDNTSVCL